MLALLLRVVHAHAGTAHRGEGQGAWPFDITLEITGRFHHYVADTLLQRTVPVWVVKGDGQLLHGGAAFFHTHAGTDIGEGQGACPFE